jgi:hypothetical protein
MISFPTPGIGETIVQNLKQGPLKTKVLIENVQMRQKNVTVQGVYKALRSLRRDGIVLLQKKEAVLNQSWLQQIQDFAQLAEYAYRNPLSDSGHFLQMNDGDRITYEFKDPVQVDMFWNHLLYVLFDAFPNVSRWYAYASHCWFMIGRHDEEEKLKKYMNKRGIQYLFTAGHRTMLDRSIAGYFDGTKSQYHMRSESLFAGRANYLGIVLNVFGDYVIEAHYDKNTTNRIEEFYKTHSKLNDNATAELQSLLKMPSRIKFTIELNKKKADRLSKMFERHFYFEKNK